MGAVLLRLATFVVVVQSPATPAFSDVPAFAAVQRVLRYVLEVDVVPRPTLLKLDPEVRACAADEGCIARRLAASGIDRALLIAVNLTSEPYALSARLVDVDRAGVVASALATASSPALLEAEIERLAVQIASRAEWTIGGRLIVEGVPRDATVAVETPTGLEVLDPRYLLGEGERRIHVTRAGYEPSVQRVQIRARSSTPLSFSLDEERAFFQQWWVWAGVGVIVVSAAAIGGYFLFRPAEVDACLGNPMACSVQ